MKRIWHTDKYEIYWNHIFHWCIAWCGVLCRSQVNSCKIPPKERKRKSGWEIHHEGTCSHCCHCYQCYHLTCGSCGNVMEICSNSSSNCAGFSWHRSNLLDPLRPATLGSLDTLLSYYMLLSYIILVYLSLLSVYLHAMLNLCSLSHRSLLLEATALSLRPMALTFPYFAFNLFPACLVKLCRPQMSSPWVPTIRPWPEAPLWPVPSFPPEATCTSVSLTHPPLEMCPNSL